jgi:hypothetical protein
MPIDSSIYFQQETPDFLGAVQKGLNMRQLVDQRNKQKMIDEAFKAGVVANPDGSTTFDNSKTLSALAKADPREAMAFQHQSQSLDMEKQKALREKQMFAADMVSRVAPSIKDQQSYEAGMKSLHGMGIDVSVMPQAYDPNLVNRYALMANSVKDKAKMSTDQQEADAKTLESRASAANAGLPFSKTGNMGRPSQPSGFQPGPTMSPMASRRSQGNLVASNGPGGAMGRPSDLIDKDPAELLANVPAKDRDKVAAQIDAAKNAAKYGPEIMNHFNNAYKWHGADLIPGMSNADQKAFHSIMGPTFADIEHTVRQAAMDNAFNNMTPQFGDSEYTRKTKRDSVGEYLTSKTAASLAKNYGIDLSKYKATNVRAALDAINKEKDGGSSPKTLKTHEIEWAD